MTVYLVGAGPGDLDLLTLKAARVIGQADVVVVDRLVGPAILSLAPPWAEIIPVGKDPAGHSVSQQHINELLISRSRQVNVVVRLKGGDPFVFGRGGEEAQALAANHVPYKTIPGISSALAGPLLAGVPVTHRGLSAGFTVVTGQMAAENGEAEWAALAKTQMTLVLLMAARRAGAIRRHLMAGGLSESTPVAVITWAATPRQQTSRLLLGDLGREPVANPSVIVIGEVAALDLQDPIQRELSAHQSAMNNLATTN